MGKYAEKTEVSTSRSLDEIERVLNRYGATQFMYGRDDETRRAVVMFTMNGKRIRFMLPLPDRNDEQFTLTPSKGWRRSEDQARDAYDQAVRQRWRALTLAIKSKLESVESGIELFEEAFAAQLVLPNGQTVGEFMLPQVNKAIEDGGMPAFPLLGNGS